MIYNFGWFGQMATFYQTTKNEFQVNKKPNHGMYSKTAKQEITNAVLKKISSIYEHMPH